MDTQCLEIGLYLRAVQIESICDAMVHLLTSEDFTMADEACLGLSAVPAGQRFVVGRQERLVQEPETSIADAIDMPLGVPSSAISC